ncbi:formate hydrogenlyase [Clostridium thermosuccinogenes]|uniref:Formate hydrogenlyase n=1 Tax=Clostridium thermosuccinogenes TaxID=84032 RepID=A0A2K2FEB7_9CLOT|nr:4Fe-4S binding protein [Pseudoclostridium thermosuccinogenes]AUS98324.1 formate hydrogenlyase [Pseudoclostridium thermosuccinogenes]PNT95811.1 formate hydrogenlyase [Pseudoclostridium thermosuccinogenes]PNT97129.1 formate hydrogenlyase [Pseudoclostridium thermosuccinogenes]
MFDMIRNVLKNMVSKPATRNYPLYKRPSFKDTRGRVGGNDMEKCIFCGICSRKCPSQAIKVNKTEKTWEIDPFKCVICGECASVCPKKSIYMDEQYTPAAYRKEKSILVQTPKPAVSDDRVIA